MNLTKLVLILWAVVNITYAQEIKIPDIFISSLKDDYLTEKDILIDEKSKNKKSQDDFVMRSSYHLKDILQGGKVTFDDPITIYLNQVMDTLLQQNNMNEDIQVYCIRSSNVNAFASDHGVIFVTTGLIAKCQNEAEIAFILGHEVTHYLNKHSLNRYVETVKIDKKTLRISVSSVNKGLLAKSNYSVQNEYEADANSANLMLKSTYDKRSCVTALQLLQKASLPIEKLKDLEPMDIGWSSDSNNQELFELPDITFKEQEEIKFPTHPKINDRIAILKKTIGNKRGEVFLNSQAKFDTIKSYSEIDLCNILLQEMNFEKAFYVANNLPVHHGQVKEDLKAKSLYLALKIKESKYYSKFQLDIQTCDPALRIYSHFLFSIEKNELEKVFLNFVDEKCSEELQLYKDQITNELQLPSYSNQNTIIVEPKVVKYDFRKKQNKLYLESEDAEQWYIDLIDESFKAAGSKNEVLSMNQLTNKDVDQFKEINTLLQLNNYNTINNYYALDLLPMNLVELAPIFKKYDCSIVGTCFSTTARRRSGLYKYAHVASVLVMSGFSVAALPYMIGVFTYKAQSYSNKLMLFDSYSPKESYIKEHSVISLNPTKNAYKSSLYYLIDQYEK